jgi:hypothetical protein
LFADWARRPGNRRAAGVITDLEFFDRNPERTYRLRLAFPAELGELQPAPDLWVYVVKCRHLPRVRGIFETTAAPKIGELDDEAVAQELFQGLLEIGDGP